MSHVELPRALEDYFAHAETAQTRAGRRFTITLPYRDGQRLDRLQWWWQVSATQEQLGGDEVVAKLRTEAVTRFRRHIERWLENTDQRLHGAEPFPLIARMPVAAASEPELPLVLLPEPQVANG
jgi:CHAD domain-containing protein